MTRRGHAGGASELLSKQTQARVDEYMMNALEELGSDLPYAELFKTVV